MDTENLPAPLHEQLVDADNPEETAEDVVSHLDDVSDVIDAITSETREANVCYAQSHVMQRAANLFRELHSEADELGEREAEMMALAIILDSEADKTVY